MKATTLPTLRERWNLLGESAGIEISSEEFIDIYNQYVIFTAQSLRLGQFVPCNSKGEPMEKPPKLDYFLEFRGKGKPIAHHKWRNEYQKALDACIFDGWEISADYANQIINGKLLLSTYDDCFEETIEELINSGIPLTLKPNHAKELGLTNKMKK